MNKKPCPRCGEVNHEMVRVERSFPKTFRHPKYNYTCSDCGIAVSTYGGNLSKEGWLLLIGLVAVLLDVLVLLWPESFGSAVTVFLVAIQVGLALYFGKRLYSHRPKMLQWVFQKERRQKF